MRRIVFGLLLIAVSYDVADAQQASVYSTAHHGRKTASGELFDMNALTAAHRTFPFGSRVRVTNRVNSRTVVVRINDRGPFVRGRVIDLSRGAAAAIGMRGTTSVYLELLNQRP
jgi:rare lipoprotein A